MKNFWDKANKGDVAACWTWKGATRNGYGVFSINGILESAHRVVYQLEVGYIPPDKCVCHHCDNRLCVNPDHLFIGTQSDNMKDAYEKGRVKLPDNHISYPKGENHPSAKITSKQAIEIKQRIAKGDRHIDIAKDFPISRWMISKIATGRCWTHI